jgi:hypothetical protein
MTLESIGMWYNASCFPKIGLSNAVWHPGKRGKRPERRRLPGLAERPASVAPMHFCRTFRFLKSLRHMVLYVAYSIVYNIEYRMDYNTKKYSKHNTKRFISRLQKMN